MKGGLVLAQAGARTQALPASCTDAATIGAYLSSCHGKHIVFPASQTYTIDQPITINGATGTTIDWNNCTVKIPDNYAYGATYQRTAVNVTNCQGVTLNDLVIDGNRANNVGNDGYGLYLASSTNIFINRPNIHDCIHHGVWIYENTVNLQFVDMTLTDNFGFATCADVYNQANAGSSATFTNTTITRSTITGRQGFYCNSAGTTTITTLTATNVAERVLDYRQGTHTATGVNTNHCSELMYVQGAASDVTLTNATALDCVRNNNTESTGLDDTIRIYQCGKVRITGVSVSLADAKYYGLRLYGPNLADIVVTNFTVVNARQAAVEMYWSTIPTGQTIFNNVTVTPDTGHGYGGWVFEMLGINQDVTCAGLTINGTPNSPDAHNVADGTGQLVIL